MGTTPPRKSRRPSALLGERVHGDVRGDRPSAWEAVWELVRRIPRGRLMTYGQIAGLLESRLSPRAVGWAMHGCPADVPWQRVVNASGGCSTERLPDMPGGLQQALLEQEGIVFGENGRTDVERYRWSPRQPLRRRATRTSRGRSGACRP